jgi:hypothetical protein
MARAGAASRPETGGCGRDRLHGSASFSSLRITSTDRERVLTDIMNAPAGEDISAEQRWAEDLVVTSRLYRQDAVDAGEHSVALVLDELERSLLEIIHTPSRATAANLEEIRRRIDAASLLFKVRVLGDELREREHQDTPRLRARAMQTS